MKISRRKFIETGSMSALSIGAAGVRLPRRHLDAISDLGPDLLPESYIWPFASKAVDSAMKAGASYADVRIIRRVGQGFDFRGNSVDIPNAADGESIGFGVRALVKGCFGFAASPYLDLEEANILAISAVEQAKANSNIRPRELNWISVPAQKGRWVSPGEDPFMVPLEERIEFFNAWREDIVRFRDGANFAQLSDRNIAAFSRMEKFIATSDGTAVSQVVYNTEGRLSFVAGPRFAQALTGPHACTIKGLDLQQGGWEVFKKANPVGQIPGLVAEAVENSKIGLGTFDVGRYDLVLDGSFVGKLISHTFGITTQLDRALGYEANADGTSYLGPNPEDFLETQVANQLVSIKCDHSGDGKLSTVKWDDEGTVASDFDLVKNGTLVNYQSSRESSAKLNSLFKKSKSEGSYQGCAKAQTGLHIPLQTTPNLELVPNAVSTSLQSMISGIKRGFFVYGGDVTSSFNGREGLGTNVGAREIRDGKLGDFVPGFNLMFNTAEIWKNVTNVGDATTMRRSNTTLSKGEPRQTAIHNVDAVAMAVKDVPLIDPRRKA